MADQIEAEADRRIIQPNLQALPMPAASIRAAETFAMSMAQLNDTINRNMDQQTVREASAAGALAGKNPEYKPRKDNTIAAEAFNRAANEVYLSNLHITTRRKIDELKRNNPANPQAFREQVDAYTGAIITDLESSNPELVQPYIEAIERNTRPIMNDLTGEYQKNLLDQATAESATALDASLSGSINLARALPLTDEASADLALEREAYINQLLRYGPAAGFEYDGQTYEQDISRPSVFTVEEIGEKVKAYDDSIMVERAMGEFNRVMVNDGLVSATVAAEAFRLSDTPNISPEVKEQILTRMGTDLTRARRVETAIDQNAGDTLKAEQDALAKTGYNLMATGNLTWAWLDSNRDDLGLADYKALLKGMSGGADNDIRSTVMAIESVIDAGQDASNQIREAYINNQITDQTYRNLRGRNEKFFGKEPEQDYKRVSAYLYDLTGGDLEATRWDDIATNGTVARLQFDRWYDQFKQENEQLPSYDDQMAKAEQLINQYFSTHQIRKYFRDRAPKPSPKYRIVSPDNTTLDIDKTARRIFDDFPDIDVNSPYEDYPQALRNELDALTEYQNMLIELQEIEGVRNATGR